VTGAIQNRLLRQLLRLFTSFLNVIVLSSLDMGVEIAVYTENYLAGKKNVGEPL
jgi:hypothetical protein